MKKPNYQPHFTKREDLERIEKLMEKHGTTNVREAISLEMANWEKEPGSIEAQWLTNQAQALANAAADVVVKFDRMERAFETANEDGEWRNYAAAICGYLTQVGKAYPELYEGMDKVETYITASNI